MIRSGPSAITIAVLLLAGCSPICPVAPQLKSAVATNLADPSCNRYRIAQLVTGRTVIQHWSIDHWEDPGDTLDAETLDQQRAFVRRFSCENQRVVKVISP